MQILYDHFSSSLEFFISYNLLILIMHNFFKSFVLPRIFEIRAYISFVTNVEMEYLILKKL